MARARGNLNLRVKSALVVSMSTAVILVAMIFIQNIVVTGAILEDQRLNTVQQSSVLGSLIDSELRTLKATLSFCAASTESFLNLAEGDGTREAAEVELKKLSVDYPMCWGFFILSNPDLKIIAASNPGYFGTSLTRSEGLKAAIADEPADFFSEKPDQYVNGAWMMPLGSAIGRGRGYYLVAMIGVSDLTNEYFKGKTVGRDGYSFMIDADGRIIAHATDATLYGKDLSAESFIKEMLASKDEGRFVPYFWKGTDKYLSFKRISRASWVVAASIFKDNVLKGARDSLMSSALIGGCALVLIAFTLVAYLNRSLIRRFAQIGKVIDEAASGDLADRLPAMGGDELGTMGRKLNAFLDSISGALAGVSGSLEKLTATGETLATGITETAASVNEIHANVASTQNMSRKESEALDETAAVVEEMARNIESLGNAIRSQAATITQSAAAVEQMVSNVKSVSGMTGSADAHVRGLLGSSEKGRERIDQISDRIRRVSSSSERLGEATQLISSIASQTNLLAMNAAIEAAHAGEAGRGFAVVADEIRKLAEGAAAQATLIEKDLGEVKELIEAAVGDSGATIDAFEDIAGYVAEVAKIITQMNGALSEQAAGSAQVLQTLVSMRDITEEVRNGSAEMTAGNERLLRTASELKELNKVISAAMDEITLGTEEINKAINSINDLGAENKESINEAAGRVSMFKLHA